MATTAHDYDDNLDPSGERTFSQQDLATAEMIEDASCSVKPRRGACFWKAKRLKKKEAKAKAAGTSNSGVAEDMAGPSRRQSGSSGSNGEASTRDTQEGPGAKRRKRKRNRVRLYKKYSEMTWEEKKAKEEAEEKKAQAKDVQVPLTVPRDRGGRQGRAAQRPSSSTFRPHAPRNTTQFLIDEKGHTSSAGEIGAPDLDEWMLDNAFGSMQGVLKKPLVRMSMEGDIEFNESDNSHSADSGPTYSHLMDQLKEKDAYIKLLEDTTDSLTRELNRLRSFLGPDHPFLADAPPLPPFTSHEDGPTSRVLSQSWTTGIDSAPHDSHQPLAPPSPHSS